MVSSNRRGILRSLVVMVLGWADGYSILHTEYIPAYVHNFSCTVQSICLFGPVCGAVRLVIIHYWRQLPRTVVVGHWPGTSLIQILCLSFPPTPGGLEFSEQILCCLDLDVVISLPLAELPVVFLFLPTSFHTDDGSRVYEVAMYPTCEKCMCAADGYETCAPPSTFRRQRGLDLRHY
ncbi:hypothetical protein BDV27DRAFT_1286 [Aspergillus caelatus]|uniref:Uncharacterized protein n=1 Tax=Aspergillus caelatus TaxID=61420 RepID=A0A5N7AK36_9EURO|nr:uncharacterized protein BDV27DRAFT_1286 [Aspergillus caelatus]KAE8369566.1 hypothetical protein BDV27DRAFT_1286 [Aspergillus caelatus]